MTLGAQLKTAREKKGYTLKQLSEISGLSIGFISQVERGQTDPSLSSLKNLATALDLKLRKDMQGELKNIQKSLGITFIYVTHDQEEALSMSDTVVVMDGGKIQQIGSPQCSVR